MTTSSNFDTTDDGSDSATGMREGVQREDWESDTLSGYTDDDAFLIKDGTLDEGHIKSTLSVPLSEME